MEQSYWFKQTTEEPLYENLLWSKPENKLHAGKLLIIGGNEHVFSAPGEAYNQALKSGVGVAKVLLPDVLQKTVGKILENGEFAPSNKSGSFAKTALAEWLAHASWADAVLFAGDVGRNSETTIALEQFYKKYSGQLTITQDSLDLFLVQPEKLFERPNTTIVASFSQLQKMWSHYHQLNPLTYDSSLVRITELLHQLTQKIPAFIITKHQDELIIAVRGNISTTKNTEEIWRVRNAAKTATWWLQNPDKPFEALSTAIVA